MQFNKLARATAPAALLIAGLLIPTGAFAHEHRDIDSGMYTVVVGWDKEPPVQGQPNAATVRISRGGMDSPQPVEGAEQTLVLHLQYGGMTMEVPLNPIAGKPGNYSVDITPDRVGDVQWTLLGTINGDPVKEVFDTADGKFDAVKPGATADAPMAPMSDDAAPAAAQMLDLSQLTAALDVLDNSGLHDLDMSLQAGTIPAGALERVHLADTTIASVTWPAALHDSAVALNSQLDELHEALESNDMAAAMQPATEAHEAWHVFSGQAHAWLAAQGAPTASTAAPAMDMDHAAGAAMPGMDMQQHADQTATATTDMGDDD